MPRARPVKEPTLAGLTRRRVRALARALGDDEIDDFLEGKTVSEQAYETIFRFYDAPGEGR
ncbi:hypothetical protein [Paraburkholderia sp. J76]|uniref:hypothetical protein n=1 Tax=Paraburkholderia sp. J76 TaxID=2805439 RepID=UPI002ABEA1D9|nr:hypothetical protein [Paraburkholderia sp. J76]